ncbi:Mobile element protein [Candidatus Enterovibrio escicola]|uniref:Mobile element protein n=1 Tax=Candidatus Enterovibrio escicola TaxID=1927127 RepID=A0A2A5T4E8_9GAMM|nr:hypothetical protein [Candidatus Enterovibrio escacola]PCS23042.1 Mobile element protein [Candidatus Enterovibrio escacola]
MNNLNAIFVDVDDFCKIFLPAWGNTPNFFWYQTKNKPSHLSVREVMIER